MKISLKLNRAIGKKVEISRVLNNLGYTYYFCGDYDNAIDCLKESLDINLEIGTKKDILYNYENLSKIMITSGQINDSLKYLKAGLTLSEKLDDKAHLAIFNIHMGYALLRIGRIKDADNALLITASMTDILDDQTLKFILDNHRAELRLYIGDYQNALEIALHNLKETSKANDKQNMLNALLLMIRLSDNNEYYNKAVNLAKELGLKREKNIAMCNMFEFYLNNEIAKEAQNLSNEFLHELEKDKYDLEIPRFYNTIGELFLCKKQSEDAYNNLIKAQKMAKKYGLLPELIDNAILLGKYYYSKGDYEECFKKYKEGLKYSKIIIE